jgi:hypothetical protein
LVLKATSSMSRSTTLKALKAPTEEALEEKLQGLPEGTKVLTIYRAGTSCVAWIEETKITEGVKKENGKHRKIPG